MSLRAHSTQGRNFVIYIARTQHADAVEAYAAEAVFEHGFEVNIPGFAGIVRPTPDTVHVQACATIDAWLADTLSPH